MQSQDAVAKRAIALGLIALRAQAENGISYRESEKERFQKLGEDLVSWAREQKVEGWFTKSEKKLHRKELGDWTRSEIAEKFWRIESMKTLLWAIKCLEKMPTYFEVGNVKEAYANIPTDGSAATFLSAAKLRPKKELQAERHFAKFLNWRCRTEMLRLQGMPPIEGDTYEAVIARALDGIEDEGIQLSHDGGDILVDGVRFTEMEGQKKGTMMSICYERHLALEWICSKDDWDRAHADT